MISALLLAVAFEKIAWVDSFDFAKVYDIETKKGTRQIVDYIVDEVGATGLYWRHQSGGLPRYPSEEELVAYRQGPFEKRVGVSEAAVYGWVELFRGETNLLAYAMEYIRSRGCESGIHYTWEESHAFGSHGESGFSTQWNWMHPQFSCKRYGRVRRVGYTASLVYDEVLEHKLRRLDEVLATGAETICIDLWRQGGWFIWEECVPELREEFKARHGEEFRGDWTDPRWPQLVSKYLHRYLRAMKARIDGCGHKARLVFGMPFVDLKDEYVWKRWGIDWKALAAEGVFDGIFVMSVEPGTDKETVWDNTRKIYEYVMANRGKAVVYFPLNAYKFTYGMPSYCKTTGLTQAQVAAKLLALAKEVGGQGVIMEVVDYRNYSPETCKVLRSF